MINTKQPSYGPHPQQNASLLLEKTKANIRRATPDSEAVASSDDDQDQLQRSMTNMSFSQTSKPTRRPSWLSDTYSSQRKPSGSLDALNAATSHQMTSSVDAGTGWGAPGSTGRGPTSGPSLPWNNAIWGNDASKILPSRFAEVLPSPTSMVTPTTNTMDQSMKTASPRRDSSSDAAIPFPIPLQPTLKTYRSQSYSVGQMEQEANAAAGPMRSAPYAYNGRTRAGSSFAGMHHRPGRSGAFGDFTGENLGQVQEVEDDEESATGSDGGVRFSSSQARAIEQLAMENAVLRQQAMANHAASFSGPFNMGTNPIPRANMRGFQLTDSVLEEPDDQGDELRSNNHPSHPGIGQHRYNGSAEGMRNASPEYFGNAGMGNKSPASFKRGQWHSGGYSGFGDGTQSRRHSFADVPRRTPSGTPHADGSMDPSRARAGFGDPTTPQTEGSPFLGGTPTRPIDSNRSPQQHAHYHMNPQAQARMQQFTQQPSHIPQNLYLVTFKAARAEFYYVQEGTGLEVNEGDLVIVEADRGTDLGTVAHKNVDWSVARELKEHYVQEHYNWLMMFSRQGQQQSGSGGANAPRPSSSGNQSKPGLLPGFGSQGSSTGAEASVAEIKPKMIKRLAQTHEIHTLREKEGNEAKAKRMCQQKVVEHHLNMEILDAEFQMDWKKLTFYYFADSYINFNSLVTDLFKIYKTRIWMSAINPASFVSRNPALPPIAGASSNAFSGAREQYGENRPKTEGGYASGSIGMQEQTPYEQTWFGTATAAQNSSFPGPTNMPYAQFWAAQGLQPIGQPGMAGPGRSQPSPHHNTPSPGVTRYGAPDVSNASATDPSGQASYADSLPQSLRGLSLNH